MIKRLGKFFAAICVECGGWVRSRHYECPVCELHLCCRECKDDHVTRCK